MEDALKTTLSFGKIMASSYRQLSEEEYDGVDNVLGNVFSSFETEFALFLFEVVKNNVNQFNWSFAASNSELFGKSWDDMQKRYQLMDDAGKEDLYIKIGLFLRKYFLEKFSNVGEKAAIMLADKFKKIMIDRLRDQQIQARKV